MVVLPNPLSHLAHREIQNYFNGISGCFWPEMIGLCPCWPPVGLRAQHHGHYCRSFPIHQSFMFLEWFIENVPLELTLCNTQYVPDTVLGAFYILFNFNKTYDLCNIIIISKQLSYKETEELVQIAYNGRAGTEALAVWVQSLCSLPPFQIQYQKRLGKTPLNLTSHKGAYTLRSPKDLDILLCFAHQLSQQCLVSVSGL